MKMNGSKLMRNDGYTLVEVLIGILIFAVGMMALAQLQGNLARSGGDANARTVAMNVAEETIEQIRVFSKLDTGGGEHAFEDIDPDLLAVSLVNPVDRAGFSYTIDVAVDNYWYNASSGQFEKDFASDKVHPDFKQVAVTVSWDDAGGFNTGSDSPDAWTGDSGSITITDVISSMTSPSGGKVALGGGGGDTLYSPPVDYNPGTNPDIVSINLGDNKFKESTTPLPDVLRTDELVETAFDVVTYSNPNTGTGATFLRREEFRAISCECTLRVPTGGEGGLRPTIWNGEEYDEGEFVSKPYGESASNQQSDLCGLCCRDHHDGGNGEYDVAGDPGMTRYGPFRSSEDYHKSGSLAGDHKHFNRDATGHLVLAEKDGDRYVEACRLVRKDGFFRVAQDLRQEGLNAFPANFLDSFDEVEQYSDYVTKAVNAYKDDVLYLDNYETRGMNMPKPGEVSPAVAFPASSFTNPTLMSESSGYAQQQLRSRGIYLDYMTEDLRSKIHCLDGLSPGESGDVCDLERVSSALEIIPFYDVQLTWLSRWIETPSTYPIDVTNQAIADQNAHSRGMAALTSGYGDTTIKVLAHSGNLGLTGTDPIDENYAADERRYNLYARALDPSLPPPMSSIRVYGSILSSVPGLKAADVEIEGTGAACERTNTGFECTLEEVFKDPNLRVYNYDKAGKMIYACSAELELNPPREHVSINGKGSWTNFSLDVLAPVATDIVIKEGGC